MGSFDSLLPPVASLTPTPIAAPLPKVIPMAAATLAGRGILARRLRHDLGSGAAVEGFSGSGDGD